MQPGSKADRAGRPIDECMGDLEFVERALARGVAEALRRHKRAGNPVAEWRDGAVRWIPPEEIQLPDVSAA